MYISLVKYKILWYEGLSDSLVAICSSSLFLCINLAPSSLVGTPSSILFPTSYMKHYPPCSHYALLTLCLHNVACTHHMVWEWATSDKKEHGVFIPQCLNRLHQYIFPYVHSVICNAFDYSYFAYKWYSMVYMYNIFIICLSVGVHLCCFHFLVIVNRLPMDIAE